MEHKYTPGPWEVVNGSDVFTGLGARNAAGVEAAENDGWHIADCDMGPSSTREGDADIPHAEKLANARLIAAAPDLLAALDDLLTDMVIAQGNMRDAAKHDPRWEGCAEAIQPRVNAARAAIAKATGSQT